MALASGPARRALRLPGRLGFGGDGTPRRGAYEWGVRSTRKPEPPPLDRVYEIPGLEPITYAGKMHFMPGLARPVFPPWDPGWTHPKFRRAPPIQEHPLYKDQACYTFHQRCRLLEGEARGWVGGGPVLPSTDLRPSVALGKTLKLKGSRFLRLCNGASSDSYYELSGLSGL